MRTFLLVALFCLLAFSAVFGESVNFQGFGDTANIATFKADSLKYSKAFPLGDGEKLVVVALSSDTSAAGFASDSIKYAWGYQLGDIVLNASGRQDTTWRAAVAVDTMDLSSPGDVDTSYVTGFAVQSRYVTPGWSVVLRFWCQGLTGNELGTFLRQRFALVKRDYQAVRSR